jgi:hypothetical protein
MTRGRERRFDYFMLDDFADATIRGPGAASTSLPIRYLRLPKLPSLSRTQQRYLGACTRSRHALSTNLGPSSSLYAAASQFGARVPISTVWNALSFDFDITVSIIDLVVDLLRTTGRGEEYRHVVYYVRSRVFLLVRPSSRCEY